MPFLRLSLSKLRGSLYVVMQIISHGTEGISDYIATVWRKTVLKGLEQIKINDFTPHLRAHFWVTTNINVIPKKNFLWVCLWETDRHIVSLSPSMYIYYNTYIYIGIYIYIYLYFFRSLPLSLLLSCTFFFSQFVSLSHSICFLSPSVFCLSLFIYHF